MAEVGGEYPVTANRYLMVDIDSQCGFHVRYDSAANTTYPHGCLGDRVTVANTWAYGTKGGHHHADPLSEDFGDAPLSQARESGKVTGTNPQLDANFVPTVTAAQAYGSAAP